MSDLSQRNELLDILASLPTTTLDDDWATFLPPPNAKRILAPSTTLVIGSRGSGKSALARFLVRSSARLGSDEAYHSHKILKEYVDSVSFCLSGFTQYGTGHPNALLLDPLVQKASDEGIVNFWMIWLAVSWAEQTIRFQDEQGVVRWRKFLATARSDVSGLFIDGSNRRAESVSAIEQLHESIQRHNRSNDGSELSYTVVYDDLDMVGANDPALRARFIRGLLTLWTGLSSRFKYLRAKIFLPSDLFDTRQLDTVDVSKLMARSERLEWDSTHLYRLVLRHLGQHDVARNWLESLGVQFTQLGDDLGWMPSIPSDDVLARWLGTTLRSVVAINGTRSKVQRWIPNRLRDGQDRVAPRSVLGFFRQSAIRAKERPPTAHWNHLMSVQDAADALKEVGSLRVAEIRPVYPWVDRLEALRGKVLPLSRRELEALVENDPEGILKPTPARDGRTVVNELIRLGLLRDLGASELLDLPDLFAEHFEIRRRESLPPGQPASVT